MLDETTTGHALQRLRELSGLNERSAARALGVHRSELRAWESGRSLPDDAQLARAVAVYGRDLRDVIATRRSLTDPERPGVLIVGDEEIFVADHVDTHPDPHRRNAALLRSYVGAVRRQRGVPSGQPVELRSDDLVSLAVELDLGDEQLQTLLAEILDLTPTGAQFTVRALLVGALVAVLASGVVQSTWMAPSASATTAPNVAEHTLEAPTFWAGDLGPTERGPTFAPDDRVVIVESAVVDQAADHVADVQSTDQAVAVGDLAPAEAPPAPSAEVTPDEVPYAIFSVQPTTGDPTPTDREHTGPGAAARGDADEVIDASTATPDLGARSDGSGVFSVTPRENFAGSQVHADHGSTPTRSAPAALPPGSPALPPAD